MIEYVLLLGCIVVPVALAVVVARSGTALFGLTLLNVFVVASATLPVFAFGSLLGELPDTFTAEHLDVLAYSQLGLLAMVGGIYLAWRPLMLAPSDGVVRLDTRGLGHITEKMGWLCFAVGIFAELFYGVISQVPTLSTAAYALSALARIGLFILLVVGFRTGKWPSFWAALGLFAFVSLVGALQSGHTFLRMNTLIPLFVIWVTFTGLTVRNLAVAAVSMSALTIAVSAWLQTRIVIRSGSLEGLPMFEKMGVFMSEYLGNIAIPDAVAFMGTLRERVDMSDILAAQVRHQPTHEPYAYGETILSSFYTLIPRVVWPGKPEVAGGSAFFERFSGLTRPVDDVTSIGLPYPFELYANGGPLWVIAGLGIIGYVCARLELKLFSTPSSLGAFWALALVTAVLCNGGQRTDVVLPALVASGVVAYVLGWAFEKFGWSQGAFNHAAANPRRPLRNIA